MNSKKVKALRKLLGIGPKQDTVLQLKENAIKRVGVISHTGNHRIEDKTTYSYVHGPKMRIYKDLKKAYKNRDAATTSAILQYYFENKDKIEDIEVQIRQRMTEEQQQELEEKTAMVSKLPEDQKEELRKKFDESLKKHYKADLMDLSVNQLETLIKITQTKGEENE